MQGAPNTRTQLLIGDGYAVLDTTREIWVTMRMEEDTSDQPQGQDVAEIKLGEIKGHGIMEWPPTPLTPMF